MADVIHRLQGPDGKVHLISAPADADPAEIEQYAATIFAPKGPKKDEYDPTEGMSELEKGVVGAGKAFVDIGRGLGQHARNVMPQAWADKIGLPTTADIAESRRLDAPLMKHGSAKVGNALGTAAAVAPLALLPGANTYAGAAATGALTGALQPFESGTEFLENTGMGAAAGPAGLAAGRGAAAGYQAVKGLVSPFFEKGQNAIVRDTLRGYAADPARAAAQLRATPPSTIPGAQQTAAEAAGDRGLAQLERTVLNHPQYAGRLAETKAASNVARVEALSEIAGDEGKMALFKQMRTELSKDVYEPLLSQPFDPKKITPWVKGEITNLKKSPSIIEATKKAEQWALDEGRRLDANSVVRGLHYTKQALDDAIEGAKPQEAMRLKGLKTRITGLLDRLTDGEYSQASSTYAELSKPINQMQVGQELLKRTQPNPYLRGTEVGIRPDAFGRAMGNPDQVARAATGYGKASMERTMTPEQQATLRELGRQFAGRSFADAAGRAAGSNTAQNLVSENYMRQLMGPMGLPQGWAEGAARSTLAKSLLRPVQWATRLGEEQVMPKLADIMADPVRAASMMAAAQRGTIGQRVGMMLDPLTAPLAVGYALPANR